MVRMLGCLPHRTRVSGNSSASGTAVMKHSTWTGFSSFQLLPTLLHSFSFFDVEYSPFPIVIHVTRNNHFNYWRHTDLFFSCSWFPVSQGRNWFIQLGSDAISGVASCDQEWDVKKNSKWLFVANVLLRSEAVARRQGMLHRWLFLQ